MDFNHSNQLGAKLVMRTNLGLLKLELLSLLTNYLPLHLFSYGHFKLGSILFVPSFRCDSTPLCKILVGGLLFYVGIFLQKFFKFKRFLSFLVADWLNQRVKFFTRLNIQLTLLFHRTTVDRFALGQLSTLRLKPDKNFQIKFRLQSFERQTNKLILKCRVVDWVTEHNLFWANEFLLQGFPTGTSLAYV
jgi:hypothetical protein